MKTALTIITLLYSISSFACIDISGKYLCPEEASDEWALGTREVQLKKSPFMDIFAMKSTETTIFEVGAWNPAIDPNSGDIDFNTETMAECTDKSVLLHNKVTEIDDDIAITVQGSYEVRPTPAGIQLRILVEGDEFFKFDCNKL